MQRIRNDIDWIKFCINLTNIINEKNNKMKEYYYDVSNICQDKNKKFLISPKTKIRNFYIKRTC